MIVLRSEDNKSDSKKFVVSGEVQVYEGGRERRRRERGQGGL